MKMPWAVSGRRWCNRLVLDDAEMGAQRPLNCRGSVQRPRVLQLGQAMTSGATRSGRSPSLLRLLLRDRLLGGGRAGNRLWQLRHSTRGSTKASTWPDARQTCGGRMTEESGADDVVAAGHHRAPPLPPDVSPELDAQRARSPRPTASRHRSPAREDEPAPLAEVDDGVDGGRCLRHARQAIRPLCRPKAQTVAASCPQARRCRASTRVPHRRRYARGPAPALHELLLDSPARWRSTVILGRVEGDGLTWTQPRPRAASFSPSRSARHAWSLMSRMRAYSMLTRRPVAVKSDGRHRGLVDRPPSVDRDEGVAQVVVRGVQRQREGEGNPFRRKPVDGGHEADGRHGQTTSGHPEAVWCPVGQATDGADRRRVVRQRLPIPMKRHSSPGRDRMPRPPPVARLPPPRSAPSVATTTSGRVPARKGARGIRHLLDDLGGAGGCA